MSNKNELWSKLRPVHSMVILGVVLIGIWFVAYKSPISLLHWVILAWLDWLNHLPWLDVSHFDNLWPHKSLGVLSRVFIASLLLF